MLFPSVGIICEKTPKKYFFKIYFPIVPMAANFTIVPMAAIRYSPPILIKLYSRPILIKLGSKYRTN